MKKLASGKGNSLGRAQRLKTLRVSSKKELPPVMLDGEKQSVSFDDDDKIVGNNLLESLAP